MQNFSRRWRGTLRAFQCFQTSPGRNESRKIPLENFFRVVLLKVVATDVRVLVQRSAEELLRKRPHPSAQMMIMLVKVLVAHSALVNPLLHPRKTTNPQPPPTSEVTARAQSFFRRGRSIRN